MATLRLLTGVEWDGVNVFPHIESKVSFDALLNAKEGYKKAVDFIRIGEPILVDMTHGDAIGYAYGTLEVDNVVYFITITNIKVQKATAVYLSYSVDWFTTMIYRGAMAIGRCHLIRSSDFDDRLHEQAVSPSDMRVTNIYPLRDFNVTSTENPNFLNTWWKLLDLMRPYLVISVMKDGGHVVYTSPLTTYMLNDRRPIGYADVYTGNFTSIIGIAPQDVTGIWVTPIRPNLGDLTFVEDTEKQRCFFRTKPTSLHNFSDKHKIRGLSFTPSHMKQYYVMDGMGHIIYQIPIGRTLIGFNMGTNVLLSGADVTFYPIFEDTINPDDGASMVKRVLENSSFTLKSPLVDYVNDTYTNWATGLKDLEADERRIQRNKNLAQGIGGSAMTGAIGGASGNPYGAVAGIVGGMAGAVLSYGVDTYYESQTAEIEDGKYRNMPDTSIPGSYSEAIFFNLNPTLSIVELSATAEDIARYNAEIDNFGVKCNLPLSSWTPKTGVYKFLDAEIIADVPYDIKNSIREKLQKGIRIGEPLSLRGKGPISWLNNGNDFIAVNITYRRIGTKKGLLSFEGKFLKGEPSTTFFKLFSLARIGAILGMTFKNVQRVTGQYYAYGVDGQLGPQLETSTEGFIGIGRFYTPTEYGLWPESIVNNKHIRAFNIEVEEL